MKSGYVVRPWSCIKISKPALYRESDNLCVDDGGDGAVSAAFFLRVRFNVSRVSMVSGFCVSKC